MRGTQFIKRILRDDRGATAIEYGLILALICIAILVTMQAVASEVIKTWNDVSDTATAAMNN